VSQFNQPPGKFPEGKPIPAAGVGLQPGSYSGPGYQGPPPKSSGPTVVVIILLVVGLVVLIPIAACGVMAYFATTSINKFTQEFQGVFVHSMANEVVEKYADNPVLVEHIGEIEEYEFEDVHGFEVFNKPVMRMNVYGDKGSGTLVFRRRGHRMTRVDLEIGSQVYLVDDSPGELFEQSKAGRKWSLEIPDAIGDEDAEAGGSVRAWSGGEFQDDD